MLKILTSDKALHFLYSFFLASIWWPLGIVFAIGKEVYDWFKYGKDTKDFWKMALGDLAADGAGIVAAMGVLGLTAIGG